MINLEENSLYTNPAERDALVADKQKCADALMFNFFGFLGLYKLSDSSGLMKNYNQSEKQLFLKNIGDENHDVSLSVKLAYEAGLLTMDVVNTMTKLLVLIKNKTVTSKNLDENNVREILKKVTLKTHATPVVLAAMNKFESGQISLVLLAKELVEIGKAHSSFKPITVEFRSFLRTGSYAYLLDRLKKGLHHSQTGATPPASATPQATPVTTTTPTPQISAVNVHSAPTANVIPTPAPIVVKTAPPAPIVPKFKPIDETWYAKIVYTFFKNNVQTDDLDKMFEGYDRATFRSKAFIHFLMNTDLIKPSNGCTLRSTVVERDFNDLHVVRYFLSELDINLSTIRPLVSCWIQNIITHAIDTKSIEDIPYSITRNSVINSGFMASRITAQLEELLQQFLLEKLQTLKPIATKDNQDEILRYSQDWFSKVTAISYAFLIDNPITVGWRELGFTATQFMTWLSWNYNGTTKYVTLEGTPQRSYYSVSLTFAGDLPLSLPSALKRYFALKDTEIGTKDTDPNLILQGTNHLMYITTNGLNRLPPEFRDIVTFYSNSVFLIVPDSDVTSAVSGFVKGLTSKLNGWNALAPFQGQYDADSILELFKNAQNEMSIPDLAKKFTEDLVSTKQLEIIVARGSFGTMVRRSFPKGIPINIQIIELILTILLIRKPYSDGAAAKGSAKGMWRNPTEFFVSILRILDNPSGSSSAFIELLRKGAEACANLIPYNQIINVVAYDDKLLKTYVKFIDWKTVCPELIINLARLDTSLRDVVEVKDTKTLDSIIGEHFRYFTASDVPAFTTAVSYSLSASIIKLIPEYTTWSRSHIGFYISMAAVDPKLKALLLNMFKDKDNKKTLEVISFFNVYIDGPSSYGGLIGFIYKVDPDFLRDLIKVLALSDSHLLKLLVSTDGEKRTVILSGNIDALNTTDETQYSEAVDILLQGVKNEPRVVKVLLDKVYSDFTSNKSLTAPRKRAIAQNVSKVIRDIHSANPDVADEIFKVTKGLVRKQLVEDAQGSDFLKIIKEGITDPNNPIVPSVKLDNARIETMLKYNNIKVPALADLGLSIPKNKLTLSMINDLSIDYAKKLSALKISPEYTGPDETTFLEKKSVEYDKFNMYRHGRTAGVKFNRSFNVYIKEQHENWAKWEPLHPNRRIMKPVFHGTGSIAACMILRYGFTIISSKDPSAVGRMLGDGIYFSTVLDKVVQYMGDGGFVSTTKGIQGYVFEMQVQVDVKGFPKCPRYPTSTADYDWCDAGERKFLLSGNTRTMVSEEGVVYDCKNQLIINKAYDTVTIDKSEMDELKKKYPQGINAGEKMRITTFAEFLNEATTPGFTGSHTYVFIDGYIPTPNGPVLWVSDEFNKAEAAFLPNVRFEATGVGPSVIIDTMDPTPLAYCVDNTSVFMSDYPEDRDAFIQAVYGVKS